MSDFDYLNDGFRGQSPRYLSYPKSVLIEYTGHGYERVCFFKTRILKFQTTSFLSENRPLSRLAGEGWGEG
ncbi:hypothetical protein, partial [Neisseria mucosa]|uniref:hypothetical protein n=1 Tax=Neisseria mucosa TaxID=488 RepID=UPI0027DF39A8